MRPWDYDEQLTEERLIKVAQLLARGRNDAVDRHDPAVGANSWTRGVCAYSYSCHQIIQASDTVGFEWLSVINDGMKFQFSIGGVPVRFWRGDPWEPSSKMTQATSVEQLLLDLEPGKHAAGVLFRIGITTDEEGALLQAYLDAVRNGNVETAWPIPLDGAEPLMVLVEPTRPDGRDLPPPPVGDQLDDQDESEDAEGDSLA